ncbi:hypothetical protein MMC20_000625 [Loxospora ochrophaea]|nr:hypothetical protein [Loxospora ochrophaea]
MAEKPLPPTPRSSRAPEVFICKELEVYRESGLQLADAWRNDSPQVAGSEGIQRAYEGLESKGVRISSTEIHKQDEDAPLKRKWQWIILGTIATIVIAVAVGGGVGGYLRHKKISHQSANVTVPVNASSTSSTADRYFNSTSPLPSLGTKTSQWRGRSIYQVMTDRFGDADKSTTSTCDTAAREYCGGTWAGISANLDYIQNMGFTAIWISPVTAQLTQNTSEGMAYHGYWQQNLFELNPNFGNVSDLQALSTAVHSRGMYLMLDVVVNHFGWAGNETTINYTILSPFDDESYFHTYCPITSQDYAFDQEAVEDCWLGDNTVSLADLNTTNPFVISTYHTWIKSLVSTFAVDGLRIDTAKHVQKSFWSNFTSAAGIYTMGEVLSGEVNYTCPYQSYLDGVLNYPLYYPLTSAFQNSSGNITSLVSTLSDIQSSCNDTSLLGTFTENQDVPRFPSLNPDLSLAKTVIAFTLLTDGIPIIYQGQEQHFGGSGDPYNREALWSSSYSTKSLLYGFIGSVNQIRNQEIYKSPDYVTEVSKTIYSDAHTIAMQKGNILGVFSNLGANSTNYTLPLKHSSFKANMTLVEVISCDNVTVNAKGEVPVPMEEGLPKIFYPAVTLQKSGICFM